MITIKMKTPALFSMFEIHIYECKLRYSNLLTPYIFLF